MVQNDIDNGWKWLNSLDWVQWAIAINKFFTWKYETKKDTDIQQKILLSFGDSDKDKQNQLKVDIHKFYEELLSEWFLSLDEIPN